METTDAGLPGRVSSCCAESPPTGREPPEELLKARRCGGGDVFPAARVSFSACTIHFYIEGKPSENSIEGKRENDWWIGHWRVRTP